VLPSGSLALAAAASGGDARTLPPGAAARRKARARASSQALSAIMPQKMSMLEPPLNHADAHSANSNETPASGLAPIARPAAQLVSRTKQRRALANAAADAGQASRHAMRACLAAWPLSAVASAVSLAGRDCPAMIGPPFTCGSM